MHTPTHRSHTHGYILVVSLVFLGIFLAVSTAFLGSITSYSKSEDHTVARTQALLLAEAGIDQAMYQLNQSPSYAGETDIALGTGTFSVVVTSIDSNTKQIIVTGSVPDNANPIATRIILVRAAPDSTVVSFRYGIQAGQGGFRLENSSKIYGNVFAAGSVIGSGGNYIYGDVVSSGPGGLVYGIHATSSVYAHTIGNAGTGTTIDKDAYYVTKTNTTVTGTSHPGSPDQSPVELPISDAQIADWESQALAGGTATCSGGTYSVSSGTVTIGPKMIPCDMNISNSAVIMVTGHLWVKGNITVQNSAKVKMDPSLEATNVAIIADKPTDQINSSKISVQNSAMFYNSGTPGSFVFLISQNKSAETGGEVVAIDLVNSASALIAYAAHGLIPLANSVALKEVTAYKIKLQNSASVTYDTGLPSAVFESGPGASWVFVPGTYAVIQ